MANSYKTRTFSDYDKDGNWGALDDYQKRYSNNFRSEQYDTFMNKIQEIANATIKKGSKLSDSDLKNIIGEDNWAWYRNDIFDSLYDQFVSDNYQTLLGDDAQRNYQSENYKAALKSWTDAMSASGIENQMLDYTTDGTLNADYAALLSSMNQATDEKYSAAMSELQRAENDMYRTLGMTQRQMERDIAKRRQQALKSGMSTAQLAAQEQQNLLAAQTGATQIAQQYADQRYNTINQFAGARAQNYTNALQSQIGWNQQAQTANQQANNTWAQTIANAYAQLYAADKSYESNKLLNNQG